MRTVLRVIVLAIAAVAVIAMCADSALAQRGGGRGGQGGRGGGGFGGFGGFGGGGGGGATQLLQDDAVKKELDLVDEQVAKLQEIASKLQEDTRAQFQGFDFGSLRDATEEERTARMAEIREKGEKLATEAQKQIDTVLLPHQRERLKQLVVQSTMRFGADRALTTGSLAEELGITEEQKQKLAAKQEEVQAALQEKMAKLRQEAQDELFSVLDTSQQAKLKSLIGKPFTFTGGGGGPGGGGGIGGGRGGRGGDGGAGAPPGGTRRPRDGN